MLTTEDLHAALLTFKLAAVTTICLLLIGTPLAWWLTHSKSWLQKIISALVSLPLILPPTVLGFYLLVFMGPNGPLGKFTESLGWGYFTFSFSGLVIGSIIYSLPFVVQPIQNALQTIGKKPLETAATLGSSPWHCFFNVVLPMCKNSFITASILGFAHTVGEFGVVLMMGGNIPNQTRVLSIAIYDHVETLNYPAASTLSLYLVVFSFVMLLLLQFTRSKSGEFT